MSWLVVSDRDRATLQPIVDQASRTFPYCSDGLAAYAQLNYHTGLHLVAPGKSETYAVEACNAELRHYLARLGRRSRCFSRCLNVLKRMLAIFIHCWNARQLFKHRFPAYRATVRDFVYLLL